MEEELDERLKRMFGLRPIDELFSHKEEEVIPVVNDVEPSKTFINPPVVEEQPNLVEEDIKEEVDDIKAMDDEELVIDSKDEPYFVKANRTKKFVSYEIEKKGDSSLTKKTVERYVDDDVDNNEDYSHNVIRKVVNNVNKSLNDLIDERCFGEEKYLNYSDSDIFKNNVDERFCKRYLDLKL